MRQGHVDETGCGTSTDTAVCPAGPPKQGPRAADARGVWMCVVWAVKRRGAGRQAEGEVVDFQGDGLGDLAMLVADMLGDSRLLQELLSEPGSRTGNSTWHKQN